MRLEKILVELKRKKHALEEAIAALESLKKHYRQADKQRPTRAKRAEVAGRNNKRILDAQTQTAAAIGGGQLIPFPGAKPSRRSRQREEVKA
ncbi:MAG TPA: hypothetical protein VMT53_23375 [Terriglobales bacterium]|nr:hypothetical protein [Terriglobales bacterium]